MTDGIRRGRPSIKGSSRLRPRLGQTAPVNPGGGPVVFHNPPKPQAPVPGRKRVLFVCIGNSCRSQMAEGFARAYGKDLIEVYSAGLSPASIVQDDTHRIMREFGIVLEGQHPKGIELLAREPFDVVVNLSGELLPRVNAARIVEWKVRDPIGRTEEVYRDVAEEIERRVTALVAELRRL